MTPVAKTGLHCGTRATTVAKTLDDTVTPVAKTGLHCGSVIGVVGVGVEHVTPVAKTGLHCGSVNRHVLIGHLRA